jgi:hypothetical protein
MMLAPLMAAALLAASAASDDGLHDFRPHCPNCVSASRAGPVGIRLGIPRHALIFFEIGEFATRSEVSVIDLDSGQLTVTTRTSRTDVQERTGDIDPALLQTLRLATRRAWREPLRLGPLPMAPGAELGMQVIADGEMVNLWPEAPKYRYLKSPIDQAIRQTALSPLATRP